MLRNCLHILVLFFAWTLPVLVSAGNIVPSDSAAGLAVDNSDVLFICNGCDVTVSDTEVEGLIWGQSLGWVNLQPADGGVTNTRLGVVGGNAWGSIAGWINFNGVFIDPETGEFSGSAFAQNRGSIVFDCPGPECVITTWRPRGCTNPQASNYDSTATVDDGSCVIPPPSPIPGCTDPNALNYSRTATVNDGSCTYPPEDPVDPDPTPIDPVPPGDTPSGGGGSPNDPVSGCMDPDSPLFDPDATISDPSACVLDSFGCTDPQALNYNPLVSMSNDSCIYDDEAGCMDITALNYNPLVSLSDGSCVYDSPENGCTNPNAVNFNPAASVDNGTCLFLTGDEISITDPNAPPNPLDLNNPIGVDPNNPFDPNNPNNELLNNPVDPSNLFADLDNDGVPDVLQSGEMVVESLLEGSPESVQEVGRYITGMVVTRRGASQAAAIALLIGSLLQTIPFREGNFLFSFFSFYRTRKYWGTVYDSVTKQPLDPAYVTLFDQAGQAVDTAITDVDGRYSFVVAPGTYFLSAQKTDYQFPSTKLQGRNYDELYSHLYFGGQVVVEKQDDVISKNIPMDPLRFNWNEYAKQKHHVTNFYKPWHRVLNLIAKIMFYVGFVFAIWVFAVSPTILSFIILSLYILAFLLKVLGFLQKIPRGYVKDKEGFALSYGVVRVISDTLQREVKHTVIAPGGHYLLLVPNGRYRLVIEQKMLDGSYQEIYRTSVFRVRRGYIAKKLTVPRASESNPSQNFNTVFPRT